MAKDDREGWAERELARRLWLLGSTSLSAYGAALVLSFQFRYGEGHRERPILGVLALLATATVCYLLALRSVVWGKGTSREVIGEKPWPEARLLRVIIGFAVVYRLVLLPSTPIQEIDFCRYLWDGRVCLNGFNPYRFAPEEVERRGPVAELPSGPASLWQLSQQSEAVRTIFQRVHHREVPTVYPPVAQAVFATAALLTPPAASFWAHVLVLKTLLVGFDLATLLLLVALLRRLHLPATWCLAYGWCPLVLKEITNSGHLDSIAVFFTTLALYWLVCTEGAARTSRNYPPVALMTAALLALGVAVLAKSYPVILLPVTAAYALSHLRKRALLPLAAFASVVIVGYVPFCHSTRSAEETTRPAVEQQSANPLPPSRQACNPSDPHSPWTGLKVFLTRWQMNDFLFMLVHENLRRPGPEPHRWFVMIPDSWREALHRNFLVGCMEAVALPSGTDPAFLLTQAIMGLLLLGLCLRWAGQIYRNPGPTNLLRAAFLTLAWGWLLSSAQNPWYLLWCLPLMVFDGRRSWFLLPGLALLYYLRFWLEYRALESEASYRTARDLFDYGVVWLEFLPFFGVLLAESWWLRRSGHVPPERSATGPCSGVQTT